jgi:hypothetical protein
MRMILKDIFDIIERKAKEKAKNWDFNTEEEYRTYIYVHELPFVEANKKEWWTKEDGKRVYIWPNWENY